MRQTLIQHSIANYPGKRNIPPVEAIKFRMEYYGLERVSEVLNHKRELSLAMIRRLHEQLHIPYENLIGKSA